MDEKGQWFDLGDAPACGKGSIVSRQLHNQLGKEATLFCMASGTSISDHAATKPGVAMVFNGKGVFNLAGKDIPLRPGTVVFMKKGEMHSLQAEEKLSFMLLLL